MWRLLIFNLLFYDISLKVSFQKQESGKLKFRALNSTDLEVSWSHVVPNDLTEVKEVILYQVKPTGYTKIGSASPVTGNTTIVVKHNTCLKLKNVFLQTKLIDGTKKDLHSSKESSYTPPSFLEVTFSNKIYTIISFYLGYQFRTLL